MESKNKKIGIIVSSVVIVVIVLFVIFSSKGTPASTPITSETDQASTSTSTTSTTTQPTPVDTTTKQSASVYKNGTYTATGTYMSPGGEDHVGVTLTLADDVITDVTVTPEPGDNMSAKYQGIFVSGYKTLVVGKNIADVNLTKVSGSSLTPKGFDDALAQIKAQAKA